MADTEPAGVDLDAALQAAEEMTPERAEELGRAAPLIAALVGQSHRDLAYTTNALLDGYKREATRARAELLAVRAGVSRLLAGPYAPSESHLREALWPDEPLVDAYVRDLEENDL